MLVIALTGGIGSGKSAVSSHLESLGVPVIDADMLAHQLVKPGAPALLEIQEEFGEELINSSGQLDRSALRKIVFNDPHQRIRLENILHPRIVAEIKSWIAKQSAPYVLLVIPLLFETGLMSLADRILVVDCDKSIQIERVSKRDHITLNEIKQIMASQVDREIRLQGADDVLINNSTLEILLKATEQLHSNYLDIAKYRVE
ncbi:MAG: dephospho-CoA kinase [Candidatus Thiodiazotropha sp.]